MKKLITILLVAVMCLSFVACGSNSYTPEATKMLPPTTAPEPTAAPTETTPPEEVKMSKEEMLQKAVEIDDYQSEMKNNIARAEAKYVGNIYQISGFVRDISKDHLNVGDFTVYLPTEDIIKVSAGQKITVVGKIDSIAYEKVSDGWGGFYDECSGVMSNAYFVTDIMEVTGYLTFYYMQLRDINGKIHNRDGLPEAWTIGLDMSNDNVTEVKYHMEESIPVNHIAGKSITKVQFGGRELINKMKITVSGKVFKQGGGYVISEAELVSVG